MQTQKADMDIYRNRFAAVRHELEQYNPMPEIITNYIHNLHDEFAEYDAITHSDVDAETAQAAESQAEYIKLLVIDIEYMLKKIINKSE
jgi:hypothetical protein